MSLDSVKPWILITIGLIIGWIVFGGGVSPVTVNIETNEIAMERWMEERKVLHGRLFACEQNKDILLPKEEVTKGE